MTIVIKCILSVSAAGLLLSGCATSYQDLQQSRGNLNRPGPGKLEQVFFATNEYSAPDVTMKFAMYRCAELAKSRNKPYFVLYDTLLDAARGLPATDPRVRQLTRAPSAHTYMLGLDAPAPGAFHTQTILDSLQSVINAGSKREK
jgi:hypothetical protein